MVWWCTEIYVKPSSTQFELPSSVLLSHFPVMFHGPHGRKDLHQVFTCIEIAHVWCSMVLLISESPCVGDDFGLGSLNSLPEAVVTPSLTINIFDTLRLDYVMHWRRYLLT